MADHVRDETSSWALVGLIVLWIAALVGAAVVAETAWVGVLPPPHLASSGQLSWLGVVLTEAITAATPYVGAFWCIVLMCPLLIITWLAIPAADRRTLPIVAGIFVLAASAAFAGMLPTTGVPFALVASLPAALTAEMLRTVITAMLRRITRTSAISASGV